MQYLDAKFLDDRTINAWLRDASGPCTVTDCCGQRFLGAGMARANITITGTPGNALGSYLNGANITVRGNAQDAVGDTMNDGSIVIFGSVGDAAGYAMRGGSIFVRGDAGYRAGIHMKAYQEKVPLMVIGGVAGSFLGEYQAGGVILVLGLDAGPRKIVSNFPCTGMHGGKMILRDSCAHISFPAQVTARPASETDMEEIRGYVGRFAGLFDLDPEVLLDAPYTVVTPDSSNPYKQMYVAN